MEIVALSILLVVVVTVALAVKLAPPGSGGAPGEVLGDEPLSEPTGASWNDTDHAGGAEDRPGGPGQEPMNPEDLPSSGSAQHDER